MRAAILNILEAKEELIIKNAEIIFRIAGSNKNR
jgi:hypothetical protein